MRLTRGRADARPRRISRRLDDNAVVISRRPLGWRILPMAIVGGAIGYLLVSNLLQIASWLIQSRDSDTNAYWEAALRLRDGLPLYQAGLDPDSTNLYRYAPWFAALWVPLTYLPREPVFVAWAGAMTACAALAVAPLVRYRTAAAIMLTAFLGGYLLWTGVRGNVQPLAVLVLARTIHGRSGPIWLGVVASLKAFPAVFALVYLGRGEWRKAALAVVCGVALALPALAMNWQDYTFNAGARPPLVPIPLLQLVLTVAAGLGTFWLARTRFAWVSAALLTALAAPRFIEYNLTYFLVGVAPVEGRQEQPRLGRWT